LCVHEEEEDVEEEDVEEEAKKDGEWTMVIGERVARVVQDST